MTLLQRLRRILVPRGKRGSLRLPRRRRRPEQVVRDEQAILRRWSQRAAEDRNRL